jgi:hypothetical protein
MLYWASYLGKKTIVDAIVRMGYSPFLKVCNGKNSLIAAIEGG